MWYRSSLLLHQISYYCVKIETNKWYYIKNIEISLINIFVKTDIHDLIINYIATYFTSVKKLLILQKIYIDEDKIPIQDRTNVIYEQNCLDFFIIMGILRQILRIWIYNHKNDAKANTEANTDSSPVSFELQI